MEYGLIGEKLGHSFSREIHNMLGNKDYILKEIKKEDLDAFMKAKDFKAINVTIPYKQDVIPYLDSIDKNAKAIGAVNTIVNKNGKLFGYNTDFIGLRRLILKTGLNLKGKKVLILGTGGTSKTATAVAKSLGARKILHVSRTKGNKTITYEEAVSKHKNASVIINTTPCGMFPKIEGCPIDVTKFPKLQGVVDVIYNPLRSNFVINTQMRNLKANGGFYMLVQQAVAAHEYFFDTTVEDSVGEKVYQSLLVNKKNIVLVGMPGCGKTTVGKNLAKELNRDFIDTDDVITQKTGKTPSELIQEKGEEEFRNIESDVVAELSSVSNSVISTGGGAILRNQNVLNLKHNGVLFFIDRNIENIRPTDNRPLSDSRDKLMKVYEKRYPIYTSVADFIIKSNENVNDTCNAVKENFNL